ncbi:MAG: Ldh family oxidoreductase [Rhizobiales bacterium]|nr:Ldh family oxidoreductase [Hyphomicrobiales bacterium]
MPKGETETVRLSAAKAVAFGTEALQRIGLELDEARTIAAQLVDSALSGYPAFGLARILTISEHPRICEPRKPLAITHKTPASARIDCGNHVGMYAISCVTDIAIAKAGEQGIAVIGATNTYLSGRNGYYLERIARAGFVGLHLVSGQPKVAPAGGRTSALGTNPIAFGLPRDPDPLVFDIGTGAVNHGDLKLAARLGTELPDGAAIDARGEPTNDPLAALAGAILPFGGHKGYGLSIAIQALGLLGGAALDPEKPQDFGYLFVVFKPGLLLPADDFERNLEELIARIKETPRQPGIEEIRIPSERAQAERARRLETGIEVDRVVYDKISEL